MRAEDNRFPYLTVTPSATDPGAAADAGDIRAWIDNTGEVPLLKVRMDDGTVLPFWPIGVVPSGGSAPIEWHPKTIVLEEGP